MQIIDGTKLAEKIYGEIRNYLASSNVKPKLGIILTTEDPASKMYIEMKQKKALEVGIDVQIFDKLINKQEDLIALIQNLNTDSSVHGILLQLPLNEELKPYTNYIVNYINPAKDVDGMTAYNQGRAAQKLTNTFLPATVDGILEAIKSTTEVPLVDYISGKRVVIINNSDLIGKPLAAILASYDATVSILNKFTKGIFQFTKYADIIISATGEGELIDSTIIQENSTLIDVTSIKKGERVIGDFIRSDDLDKKAAWITPVPGGIGPLTIACLLRNLTKAAIGT